MLCRHIHQQRIPASLRMRRALQGKERAMNRLGEMVKAADWKSEKHVPAIEAPAAVKAGEMFAVTVSVGKEIPHPNTTEHHICWIALHYVPEGSKVSYEVGRFDFSAHGQSVAGPNQGPVHTDSRIVARLKVVSPGMLFATAYCNIHGLWESRHALAIG
jgi:superoxide reductase